MEPTLRMTHCFVRKQGTMAFVGNTCHGFRSSRLVNWKSPVCTTASFLVKSSRPRILAAVRSRIRRSVGTNAISMQQQNQSWGSVPVNAYISKQDHGVLSVKERNRFRDRILCLDSPEYASLSASGTSITRIIVVRASEYPEWVKTQSTFVQNWLKSIQFTPGEASKAIIIPYVGPSIGGMPPFEFVLYSLGSGQKSFMKSDTTWLSDDSWWSFGSLPSSLPPGLYRIECDFLDEEQIALAWTLGCYSFDRFKKVSLTPQADSSQHSKEKGPMVAKLVISDAVALSKVATQTKSIYLARDLINTPAENMGPEALEKAVQALASEFRGSRVSVVRGKELLDQNYPQIHAVGRAIAQMKHREPRLISVEWNMDDASLPLVVIVGKTVCFDTGGLDIKPAAGMRNMKKDMGGGAGAIALADMIMSTGLNIRLHLLLPAVDNTIDGNAFKPGDILFARNGISTEIENTDAEGRLVLADALVRGCEHEKIALIVDMATLTGAQRVALGPDIGTVFCSNRDISSKVEKSAYATCDPLWPLPLYTPYVNQLSSTVADLKNCSSGGLGGAITAALYLQYFVKRDVDWIHVDANFYNNSSKPGKPEGGDVNGVRALFHLIQNTIAL